MQFTEFSMKKKLMLSWHFGGKPHISQNPQKYAILIFFYEKKSMLSSNNTEGKFITSNNTQAIKPIQLSSYFHDFNKL